jgi:hypothetical protein
MKTETKVKKVRVGDVSSFDRDLYGGSKSLANKGYEAVAQYLALPEAMKEFKSLAALAKYLGVSRMTLHRWKLKTQVLRRADWLSRKNLLPAILSARADSELVMQMLRRKALSGDVQAARLLLDRAWPEEMMEEDVIVKDVILRVLTAHPPPEKARVTSEENEQPKKARADEQTIL